MKTTVKQLRDFFASLEPWFQRDWLYTAEEAYAVDGVVMDEYDFDLGNYPDGKVIDLKRGYFCSIDDATKHLDGKSIESVFKKWLKQQGLKQYAVAVPISKAAEFEAACALIGVKLK